jgi:hypothetical protein
MLLLGDRGPNLRSISMTKLDAEKKNYFAGLKCYVFSTLVVHNSQKFPSFISFSLEKLLSDSLFWQPKAQRPLVFLKLCLNKTGIS